MATWFTDNNGTRPTVFQWRNHQIALTGTQVNTIYDGHASRQLGIPRPTITTSSVQSGGSLIVGNTYRYKIVHVNEHVATDSGEGSFSVGSAYQEQTTDASNQTIRLEIPAPSDTNALTHVYIYRTQANDFSQYYYLDSFVSATTTYSFNYDDDGSNEIDLLRPIKPSGIPAAARYGAVYANALFLGGDTALSGSFDLTNGSATATPSDESTSVKINQSWVGKRIRNLDQDGVSYKITAVNAVTGALTLEYVYQGATQTSASCGIAGPYASAVAVSEPGTLEEFPVDENGVTIDHPQRNIMPISADDGQVITGMHAYQEAELLVFKERKLFRIVGTNIVDYAIQEISDSVGTPAGATVKEYSGNVFFYDGNLGVWVYRRTDSGPALSYISEPLESIFENDLDHTADGDAVATIFKGMYILSVRTSGSSYNDLHVVYDIANGSWTKFTGRDINASDVVFVGNKQLWYTGDTLGRVRDSWHSNDYDDFSVSSAAVDSISSATITDSSASFNTTNAGMRGAYAEGTDSSGSTEVIRIIRNTSTTFTLESTPSLTWVTYQIGMIDAKLKTKRFDLGGHKFEKIRYVAPRFKQQSGTHSLLLDVFENNASSATRIGTIDMTQSYNHQMKPFNRTGSDIEVQLRVNAPGTDAEIQYIELYMQVSRQGRVRRA